MKEDEKIIIKDIIEYFRFWDDFEYGNEHFNEYCERIEKDIKWVKQIKNRINQYYKLKI